MRRGQLFPAPYAQDERMLLEGDRRLVGARCGGLVRGRVHLAHLIRVATATLLIYDAFLEAGPVTSTVDCGKFRTVPYNADVCSGSGSRPI